MAISISNITMWQAAFTALPINLMMQNVITQNSLQDTFINREVYQNSEHIFSHQVEPRVKITNQKSSGRCWLFAALNVMRLNMISDYDLKEYEFSQSYLFFWDKLERSNFVLESVIDAHNNNENINGQIIQHLLNDPLSDG